ncbi:MAG: hypothetical protein ACKOAD_05515, partial [Gammaproteobacteria bacterium]
EATAKAAADAAAKAAEEATAKAAAEAAAKAAEEATAKAAADAAAKAAEEATAKAAAEAAPKAAEEATAKAAAEAAAKAAEAKEDADTKPEEGTDPKAESESVDPVISRIRSEILDETRAEGLVSLYKLRHENPVQFSQKYKTSSKDECRTMRKYFGF